ncbi:ribonuclease-like [Dermochelys coriacea]|uniref:ribonuclease-like n=1 Tax=Dermochelys coriacea TaxID=27794 RepID=UPI0018E8B746|nr:ribonuclease-like [Dermochelys coriacea]
MALRGPHPLLLLTLVLLAACLAQFRPRPDTYQHFVSEHVDFPKTSAPNGQSYSDLMMRRLSQNTDVCKPTHTFIHAPASRLWAICTSRGRCNQYNECNSITAYPLTTSAVLGCHQHNECDSNSAYPHTMCQVRSSSPGHYFHRTRVETRRICMACNQERLH